LTTTIPIPSIVGSYMDIMSYTFCGLIAVRDQLRKNKLMFKGI